MHRKSIIAILALLFVMILTIPALAVVTKYVVKMPDGTVVEYDYQQLAQSYTNKLLGLPGGQLYEDYALGNLIAVFDSEKGYIDYRNIQNAYEEAVLSGSSNNFNLNNYVASDQAIPAQMPAQVVVAVLGTDGKVEKTTKPVEPNQPQLPEGVKSFNKVQSLELGKVMVIVELTSSTPERYNVYIKGTRLIFDVAQSKFTGNVVEADALPANLSIAAMPAIKSFNAVSSMEIGKSLVIVELDTSNPSDYKVSCGGVELIFNAGARKFVGNVPQGDATKEKVSVTNK